MGAFDSIAGQLALFGSIHITGSQQAQLSNSIIPVTMIVSYIWTKERFTIYQILGATIILLGMATSIIPNINNNKKSPTTNDIIDVQNINNNNNNTITDEKNSTSFFFLSLFIQSSVPAALSSVYKEVTFNNIDIDVNYLQAWVAIWQVLVGFILLPLNTLKILGKDAIQFKDIPKQILRGFMCLIGYNQIIPPNCTINISDKSIPICDTCSYAWIQVSLYLIANMLYNYFMMIIIKQSGASLLNIIMTVRLPLIQFAFAIPAINNPPDPFTIVSVICLICIVSGLQIYKYGEPRVIVLNTTELEDDDTILLNQNLDDTSIEQIQSRQLVSDTSTFEGYSIDIDKHDDTTKIHKKYKIPTISYIFRAALISGLQGNIGYHQVPGQQIRNYSKEKAERYKKLYQQRRNRQLQHDKDITQVRQSYYSKLASISKKNSPIINLCQTPTLNKVANSFILSSPYDILKDDLDRQQESKYTVSSNDSTIDYKNNILTVPIVFSQSNNNNNKDINRYSYTPHFRPMKTNDNKITSSPLFIHHTSNEDDKTTAPTSIENTPLSAFSLTAQNDIPYVTLNTTKSNDAIDTNIIEEDNIINQNNDDISIKKPRRTSLISISSTGISQASFKVLTSSNDENEEFKDNTTTTKILSIDNLNASQETNNNISTSILSQNKSKPHIVSSTPTTSKQVIMHIFPKQRNDSNTKVESTPSINDTIFTKNVSKNISSNINNKQLDRVNNIPINDIDHIILLDTLPHLQEPPEHIQKLHVDESKVDTIQQTPLLTATTNGGINRINNLFKLPKQNNSRNIVSGGGIAHEKNSNLNRRVCNRTRNTPRQTRGDFYPRSYSKNRK